MTSKNWLDFGGDPDHIKLWSGLPLPWRMFALSECSCMLMHHFLNGRKTKYILSAHVNWRLRLIRSLIKKKQKKNSSARWCSSFRTVASTYYRETFLNAEQTADCFVLLGVKNRNSVVRLDVCRTQPWKTSNIFHLEAEFLHICNSDAADVLQGRTSLLLDLRVKQQKNEDDDEWTRHHAEIATHAHTLSRSATLTFDLWTPKVTQPHLSATFADLFDPFTVITRKDESGKMAKLALQYFGDGSQVELLEELTLLSERSIEGNWHQGQPRRQCMGCGRMDWEQVHRITKSCPLFNLL